MQIAKRAREKKRERNKLKLNYLHSLLLVAIQVHTRRGCSRAGTLVAASEGQDKPAAGPAVVAVVNRRVLGIHLPSEAAALYATAEVR